MDDAHVNKQPAGHELDKQPIPGKDDLTSPEHMNLHKRLVATARSLKKQKRKLKTAKDTLRMRWSKLLNSAYKHGASHHTKSYPKRKLLPEFDEEVKESWIRWCPDSRTIPSAELLDYEDTRLKTLSRVRKGLSLAWKASLAIRICRSPTIVTDSV